MPQNRIAKLREIKIKEGLSYEQVGFELGVHSMSVYRWLQKGAIPRSRPILQAIDRFLGKYDAARSKKSFKGETFRELVGANSEKGWKQ